jgi:hypothetical protein
MTTLPPTATASANSGRYSVSSDSRPSAGAGRFLVLAIRNLAIRALPPHNLLESLKKPLIGR